MHDQNLKTHKLGFQSFRWHLDRSKFKILEPLQRCPSPHLASHNKYLGKAKLIPSIRSLKYLVPEV